MDNVMVIGAGRGQVPIINLFHKYGYSVIVVSVKGDYPGFAIADDILYTDIRNYEVILDYAKQKKIKACLTDQLDEAVSTVAYITEALGLNGISTVVAKKFTDKYIMRKSAEKAGIAIPKSCLIKNKEDFIDVKQLNFPIMIKPVDSSASHGVFKIGIYEEFEVKFDECRKFSKSGSVIAEEFIQGKEYVVDAYTHDFKSTNLIVGHRDYFNIPNTFIPCATVFLDANSATSDVEIQLKEINKKLVESFNLRFGITHAEYIYNEDENRVYLVEIAARGGGVFISSDLIPNACGVNANELLVLDSLNHCDNCEIKMKTGASAYFCYLVPEGEVVEINNHEIIGKIEGVDKAFFDNINIGMKTKSITDKSSRKGPILVHGKTKKDCYDVIQKVKDVLEIKIQCNNHNEGIIWN